MGALEEKVAEAEAKMGLLEVRADLERLLGTFEGDQLLGEGDCLEHYDQAAGTGQQGYRQHKDGVRAALMELRGSIAALPPSARAVLLKSSRDQQMDLVACCVCASGSGIGADLGWVKKERDAAELLENVAEACGESKKARERFAHIRGALESASACMACG